MLDSSSLERIVPDELSGEGTTGVATLDLHLERYQFAARHLVPGTLLDMACGVGYGTSLLASTCPDIRRAVGVDLSEDAIVYASTRYTDARIRWIAADATTFQPDGVIGETGFDNIVSLETIEHLPHPEAFFRHLLELLRPGGMLIASVPTTPSMDGNPHHLTDFTEASFRRMARDLPLKEVGAFRQEQPFSAAHILAEKEKRLSRSHRGLVTFYAQHPAKLVTRAVSTVRYGFVNRYLTVAWQRER
jgi:2-polyprenyl-3-methyl-5-hydroxy-6-metoxy-1,4-benzoquinol methylase